MRFEDIARQNPHQKGEPANEQEHSMERLRNADMFFRDFMKVRPGEQVLFLSHADPESTDANSFKP